MHPAGLELTKLTYTRLEDNLIRHRGDRIDMYVYRFSVLFCATLCGIFVRSRVTGACAVTTDLIVRVNVRTTAAMILGYTYTMVLLVYGRYHFAIIIFVALQQYTCRCDVNSPSINQQ